MAPQKGKNKKQGQKRERRKREKWESVDLGEMAEVIIEAAREIRQAVKNIGKRK